MPRRAVRILAEMLIIFGVLWVVDHYFAGGRAFQGLDPNPYWLPILLFSLAYGTGMGVVAAGLATALWMMVPHPPAPGADQLQLLLDVSLLPMLWVIVALFLGEVTGHRRGVIDELERRAMELEDQQAKISETLADLSNVNRELQLRITTENLAVGDAIDAAFDLIQSDRARQVDAVERLISLAARTEDFTFFDVRDDRAVARFQGAAAAGRPCDLSRTALAQSLLASPLLNGECRDADPNSLAPVDELSVPVRSGERGQLSALLLIHSLPPDMLTESKIAELTHVAELLGRMPPLEAAHDGQASVEWHAGEECVA